MRLWVLGAVALFLLIGFGGCLALLGPVAGEADRTVSATPQPSVPPAPGDLVAGPVTVRYEVSGPAPATNITYVADESFQLTQINGAPLPWSFETRFLDSVFSAFASVTAQAGDGADGRITCRILRDGVVIAESTSSGPYAMVVCSGS